MNIYEALVVLGELVVSHYPNISNMPLNNNEFIVSGLLDIKRKNRQSHLIHKKKAKRVSCLKVKLFEINIFCLIYWCSSQVKHLVKNSKQYMVTLEFRCIPRSGRRCSWIVSIELFCSQIVYFLQWSKLGPSSVFYLWRHS